MLDPTAQMDVYSFGLIMWEIWHEKTPFEGDVKEATEVVIKDQNRPAISEQDGEDDSDEEKTQCGLCSPEMAKLIRMCWQTDEA
jgi:hypothetical protein